MSDTFTVYDLWGSCTHCEHSWNTDDGDNVCCTTISPLHPFLVGTDNNSNKKAYVIGADKIILDDISRYSGGLPSIDTSRFTPIERILRTLDKAPLDSRHLLQAWVAGEQANFLDSQYSEEGDRLVIPVPDRLTADGQDVVLDAFSMTGRKGTLLWRSVAAYLGNETQLKKETSLAVKDKVVIIDCERTSVTVTNLWIDECKGRLIPAHRLYYNHDNALDVRIKSNYPVFAPADCESVFPYRYDNGFLVPNKMPESSGAALSELQMESPLEGKAAVVVGKLNPRAKKLINLLFETVIYDELGMSVVRGSAIFASRMRRNIVSYYDECEALNLVVQTPAEEIVFKPLIRADKRLKGGLRIEGVPVDGIFISKTSDSVHFYLRLGDPRPSAILREYVQELEMTEELLAVIQRSSIELELEASLVAGQGRAHVEIVAKDKQFREVFPNVSLDWQKLHDGKTRAGNPATLSNLEKEMDRSFPVDIRPTRVDDIQWDYYSQVRWRIDNSINTSGSWPNLNRPKWPNRDNLDVSRFDKYNIFGQPTEESDGLPPSNKDKERCLRFFDVLSHSYDRTGNDDALKTIAWTYHPAYFPKAIEQVRDELNFSIRNGVKATMSPVLASFCANMLQSDSDVILFFKAFVSKLGGDKSYTGAEGINNWLRSAYQILMYHTAFLRDINSNLVENLLIGLVATYYTKSASRIIRNNICRTLLFLLKRRRYDHSFCKEDDYGNSDNSYLHAVIELLSVREDRITDATDLFLWKYIHIKDCANRKIQELYRTVVASLFPLVNYHRLFDALTGRKVNDIKEMKAYIISTKGTSPDLDAFRKKIVRSCMKADDDWGRIVNKYLNGRGNLDIPVGDDE